MSGIFLPAFLGWAGASSNLPYFVGKGKPDPPVWMVDTREWRFFLGPLQSKLLSGVVSL